MPEKPTTAAGYDGTQLELVRRTLLYVATRLGDVQQQLTVVGGLVPSLLIEPTDLPAGVAPHVGTRDLDLGLQLAVLKEASYRTLAEGLRSAGFVPDVNARGNRTPQRWVIEVVPGVAVPVDFLIPLRGADDRAGRTAHLEPDFGARHGPATEPPTVANSDREVAPVRIQAVGTSVQVDHRCARRGRFRTRLRTQTRRRSPVPSPANGPRREPKLRNLPPPSMAKVVRPAAPGRSRRPGR